MPSNLYVYFHRVVGCESAFLFIGHVCYVRIHAVPATQVYHGGCIIRAHIKSNHSCNDNVIEVVI